MRGTWSRWTPEITVLASSGTKCVSIWLGTSCYFGCAIVDPINEESLCSALESVSKKWKEVANKAGFSVQDLEQIAEDCKEEGECLEQVVRQWLRTGVSWTHILANL